MKKDVFLHEQRHVDHLLTFVAQNWEAMAKAGAPMHLEITEAKAKRSTLANRYYWAVLGQIAEDAWIEGRQYAADPVWHEYFARKFVGVIELPGGGSMAESTSKLDKAEFAAYVQKVEVFAGQELGVTFMDRCEPLGRTA